MDELDETKALSCLQIETIVYACQVSYLLVEILFFVQVYIYICIAPFESLCSSMAEAPSSSPYWS
jgi:hypothetical protein